MNHRRWIATAGLLVAAGLAAGCATTPYPLPLHGETEMTLQLEDGEAQIERGKPNAWIDGFGHYFFSLYSKLLLLSWKVNNHNVPDEVVKDLETYLHANGLCNVKVRINQYAPGGEWRRLFRNEEMPAGWRYTIGVVSVTIYTIIPARLFAGFPIPFVGGGGDSYNPFTNTVSIYSGSRPIALHEGGHVKDLAEKENRHWKGAYAGLRAIPFVGIPFTLWQEGVASSDALSWDLATASSGESKAAYRLLYPAYGTYVGGSAASVAQFWLPDWWMQYAIQFGAVVVGHVTGQTRALFEKERAEGLEPVLAQMSACPGFAAEMGETQAPEAPPSDAVPSETEPLPVTPAPDEVEPDPGVMP